MEALVPGPRPVYVIHQIFVASRYGVDTSIPNLVAECTVEALVPDLCMYLGQCTVEVLVPGVGPRPVYVLRAVYSGGVGPRSQTCVCTSGRVHWRCSLL